MGKKKESKGTGLSPAMGGVLLSTKTRTPIAMGGALHTADVVAKKTEGSEESDQAEEEGSGEVTST
jgi:hypothetical protein